MNNKFKPFAAVSTGVVALVLLVAMSAPRIRQKPTPTPSIRPVADVSQENRVTPPAEPQPTPVGEEATNTNIRITPPTEINFEPPKLSASPAIPTPKEPPRDNTTPTPAQSQNTAGVTATEPKMGDTRTVDGQNQVYFLGFGWIEDNDMPNECIYAEDMFENGNKIGEMGGGTFVDGEGDINKMVGIMD